MSDLVECVEKSILRRRLIRRGEGVLVAVSGGLDSMVLLEVLARLAAKQGWRLMVAHFNHQLRGRSSEADEGLVRRTAERLGLGFVVGRGNVREFSRKGGVSLEMAARELRHGFLARTAAARGLRTVALAHHADDQVELFFLRLLRGAGGEGLAGMKWEGISPADARVRLARPLLGITKRELQEFARREEIKFREDATNRQTEMQRNRIRQELVPLLEKKYQPALGRVVRRQMEIVGAEAEFAVAAARRWLKEKRPAFEKLPVAVQRRSLRLQLIAAELAAEFELIEQLRENANQWVTVSGSMRVSRDRAGELVLRKPARSGFHRGRKLLRLTGGAGDVEFGGIRASWELQTIGNGIFRAPKRQANCEQFDAEKVGASIELRHWRPGDRFQPIGMENAVKLQDLFVNQGIPREERAGLIVGATAAGKLFWVEGLRMADGFKLDKYSTRRLKWRWKRL